MMKKSISAASALAGAVALVGVLAAGTAQAACEDNWKECAGKPWVDGDVMDTPHGQHLVAECPVGRGRSGRVDQLVHQARGGDAGAGGRSPTARPTSSATSTTPACRCSASASGSSAFPPRRPAARSARTGSSGTTSFSPPRSARPGRSSTASGTSESRSAPTATSPTCASTTATRCRRCRAAYGLQQLGTEKLHPIVARGILIDFTLVHGDMEHGTCADMDDSEDGAGEAGHGRLRVRGG